MPIYRHEKQGLFIGLVTAPYENLKKFHREEVESNFKNYKDGLKSNLFSWKKNDFINAGKAEEWDHYKKLKKQFLDGFYIPKTYCMFGKWDLLILSLVDDYEFGVHYFHPFSPTSYRGTLNDGSAEKSYQYQVKTGIMPQLLDNEPQFNLYNFLTAEPKFVIDGYEGLGFFQNGKVCKMGVLPLIGIISLKLNNLLLVGNSFELFKIIQYKIENICENKKLENLGKLRFMLLETTTWHELELMVFGDNFSLIGQLILKVRELKVGDLFDTDDEIKKYLTGTLIEKLGYKTLNQVKGISIFSKALVNLGFDFNCLEIKNPLLGNDLNPISHIEKELHKFQIEDKNNKLSILQRWFVKPGHIQR